MSAQRPKARPGQAKVELVAQWTPQGLATYHPKRPTRLDPRFCTWVHTKLPEVDVTGRRTTRTDWGAVKRCLQRFGLPLPDPRHQSALGAPLSEKPGVLTALGGAVVKGGNNRYGTHRAVRLSRVALVPVTRNLLISGRHRDGLDWIEPLHGEAAAALRESALLKRDPYRATSLLSSIQARGRVDAGTSAEDLAAEIILAATQAYPRAVLDKFNGMLNAAEARFASVVKPDDLDGEVQPQTSLSLLQLIAAMGRLEQAMRETKDDFESRTNARGLKGPEIGDAEAGLDGILTSLAQLRGDARTTVDMIGSTLSSAHLKIAREEARAASQQRARHVAETERRQAAEAQQREREQRLARAIALLASVLLIPTLVASVFGANVELPRERTRWGTYLMFATMIGLGALSFALLREFDPTRKAPGWKMRVTSLLIAAASLAGGVIIAFEWLGTG